MKTTRRKKIENKVFTKKDIRFLWDAIKKEHDSSQREQNQISLELEVSCVDGINYKSSTDDLLQDGDIIDTKKCTAINIEYRDYKRERRISLSLEHGNTYSNNLTVGGEKNWIFGTFESLNTIIESVKPQEHWFIKYKKLTSHVVAIWFGFLLYKLFDIILYRHITLIDNPSENLLAVRGYLHQHPVIFYSIQMALFWFQGVFLTLPLMDWILKLWPSVEFDFGPEYKKLERKRRERLGLFFSFFIIPLFVNFVYDLLTK